MKPKTAKILTWCLLGLGGVIGAIGAYYSMVIAALGVILMIGSIFVHFMFYRCPHCGYFLDRSTGTFCPHCGKKIND